MECKSSLTNPIHLRWHRWAAWHTVEPWQRESIRIYFVLSSSSSFKLTDWSEWVVLFVLGTWFALIRFMHRSVHLVPICRRTQTSIQIKRAFLFHLALKWYIWMTMMTMIMREWGWTFETFFWFFFIHSTATMHDCIQRAMQLRIHSHSKVHL